MSKDKRRMVAEVFTTTGKQYRVDCKVVLNNLRQAIALRNIITAFEASVLREENGRKKVE